MDMTPTVDKTSAVDMTPAQRAVVTARRLVTGRFADARAAWLGGSVIGGNPTISSDLDITVLLPAPPAPFRESIMFDGWPVELFVHTETSLAHYRRKDQERRQPSIMRLVAMSQVLVDVDGSGRALQDDCRAEVEAGPAELRADELASKRYAVTDLLMDLEGGPSADETMVVASTLWQQSADLLLTGSRHWTGSGKWLVRELRDLDADHGSSYAARLVEGLRASATGDSLLLRETSEEILERFGGHLFAGHRLNGANE